MSKKTVDIDLHLPAVLFSLGSKISLHAQREGARAFGVDMCEWRTLQILGRDGASTINQIADRIAMDRGGTSRAVARLEGRGLVRRVADSRDRRKSPVALTEEGAALQARIAEFANAREARLTRGLDAGQKAQLKSLLASLMTEIDRMLDERWTPESAPADHSSGSPT